MPGANLTLYINQGLLIGTLAGRDVRIRVYSGGGGGTTAVGGPEDPSAVNNPLKVRQKTTGSVRGGPIPPGVYAIAEPSKHAKLGLSARLTPAAGTVMFSRGGFYIHGRGKRGSNGCIVPANPVDYQALMRGLTADAGGTLTVYGIFDSVGSTSSATA